MRQRLEHLIRGRGLLGTMGALQDARNTCAYNFWQRRTVRAIETPLASTLPSQT